MTSDATESLPPAFFLPEGDQYVPTAWTQSAWDPDTMRGGAVSGLLAYEVERVHLDPAFQVSRVTVDLFRAARRVPVTVTTEIAREGQRIRVVDAVLRADGVPLARASVVMLRRTTPPTGGVWSPPAWDAPPPTSLPAAPPGDGRLPIWERRFISGDPAIEGPRAQRRAWLHEVAPFIAGETTSPFVRAAVICDAANPFANAGERGLSYVNADATLYMNRDPRGEWIGIEVIAHHASEGIAVGECVLYDLAGAFGRTTVCSLSNPRRP